MNAAASNAASGFKAGQTSAIAPSLSGRNGASSLPEPVGGETKTQSSLADVKRKSAAARPLTGSPNLYPEQPNQKPPVLPLKPTPVYRGLTVNEVFSPPKPICASAGLPPKAEIVSTAPPSAFISCSPGARRASAPLRGQTSQAALPPKPPPNQTRIVSVDGREALTPSKRWLLAHFSQPRYGAKGAQIFNQTIGDRPITPRLLFYVICTLSNLAQTARAMDAAQRSDPSQPLLDDATMHTATLQMKRLEASRWSTYAHALYDEALARDWMERSRLDPSQLPELPHAKEHDFSFEGLSDWFPDVEPDVPQASHAERGEENLTQEASAIADASVNERPVAPPEPERIILDERMINRIMFAWSDKQKASGGQVNGKVVEIATKFLKSASFEAMQAADGRLVQDMVGRVELFLAFKSVFSLIIYREKDRTERINKAARSLVSPRLFEPPTKEAIYRVLAVEFPNDNEQRCETLMACASAAANQLQAFGQPS